MQGIGPARNPVSLVRDMRRRARGELTFSEFGNRNKMREQRDRSLLYAGYATKR